MADAPTTLERGAESPGGREPGLHRIRNRRQLAVIRALWQERDRMARERDLSPGRVLPDAALIEAALVQPRSPTALVQVPGFTGRGGRRNAVRWAAVIRAALDLPDGELPRSTSPARVVSTALVDVWPPSIPASSWISVMASSGGGGGHTARSGGRCARRRPARSG